MARLHLLSAFVIALSSPVLGHEYWLEPEEFVIDAGENIVARNLTGEFFEGVSGVYIEQRREQAGILVGGGGVRISGEAGGNPAINQTAPGPGLNIIFHARPVATIVYQTFEDFGDFARGKDLDFAVERHIELGLPTEDIREDYYRFVKALVSVDGGQGSDRPIGMPFELVAIDNPYTTTGEELRFGLILQGEPASGAPYYAFIRQGEEVEKISGITDDRGRFTLPRRPGQVMVNAVHLAEPDSNVDPEGTHWISVWASLTYEVTE